MINLATFQFLKELSQNNNREWFQANKEQHDDARENMLDFAGQVISGLSKIDPSIPAGMDPKSCVLRIYRDIRFSKDKTPYKNNFGVGISPNGRNFNGPGYYLQISPENSFVTGGSWMPEAGQLKAIRQEIDYNPEEFRKIAENKSFKDYFEDLDAEDQLKTTPKGYPADHPHAQYLKLKSFTASREFKATELSANNAVRKVTEGFEKVYPLIVFLRNAISH